MKRNPRLPIYTGLRTPPILSVAFIAVLVTPVINDHLSHGWGRALAVANIVLWARSWASSRL
jgi:hypothetical protein